MSPLALAGDLVIFCSFFFCVLYVFGASLAKDSGEGEAMVQFLSSKSVQVEVDFWFCNYSDIDLAALFEFRYVMYFNLIVQCKNKTG